MIMKIGRQLFALIVIYALSLISLNGCTKVYYDAMEKAGVHKRDILVDRVEGARDSQKQAQEQFKSALERFESVVQIRGTDLKKAYETLNAEHEDCRNAAQRVSAKIDKVESVADALFEEWQKELDLYENREMKKSSGEKLDATRLQYRKMLVKMKRAEKSMAPVLAAFRDNVLFLKHNLNAQAIGSLKSEFSVLQDKIDGLIRRMNDSIESSDRFIRDFRK